MRPIRETCQPRDEVLKGDLQDSLFAAVFSHVVMGTAPDVYSKPDVFFSNTYPTAPLVSLVKAIFGKLSDPNEPGTLIRLSTGFGGGKTHTLIALWHLAKNIAQINLGTELLPAAGRPKKVRVVGIDAHEFGIPVCMRHGSIETHSLWGELAYQLGKEDGYERMRYADLPTLLPDAGTIRDMLPDEPTLILLDELVMYMAALGGNDTGQGQLLSFLGALITEVSARHQIVLVITDPAGQASYAKEVQKLGAVTKAAVTDEMLKDADSRLSDILGRAMSNYEAIGADAPQVILRRLFEHIDNDAAQMASAEYYNAYKTAQADYSELIPAEAATQEYANKILQCYPFHPRLLETVQSRIGALQDFNKSRGTLRLFARIVRDVWERKTEDKLINAGDLNWQSQRLQSDLLERIKRDNFIAAVEADVVHHANTLDSEYGTDMHRRVASALLLESLPLTENARLTRQDLTLTVLHPGDIGNEPAEALDHLYGVCWHLYKTDSGTSYQFRYEPNAIRIIEERAENPSLVEDARHTVHLLVQNYYGSRTFQLVAYPDSPGAVSDSSTLKLVLCDSESLAQEVCDWENTIDPAHKMPRRFRNAIVGLAPQQGTLDQAIHATRWLLAAEQVAKERKKGDALKQQIDELLPRYKQNAQLATIRAFNRVVLQGRNPLTLGDEYFVSKDQPLTTGISGQAKLMDMLLANRMAYKAEESLDVDLLLTGILPGAVPSIDHIGAFSAKTVHERALAHKGLRLMSSAEPVRLAVLAAVSQGRLLVRQPNGDVYDKDGCIQGSSGSRQRQIGSKLITLRLADDVFLAPKDAVCATDWLRVDEFPPPPRTFTLSLEEAATQKGATVQQVLDAIDAGQLNAITLEGIKRIQIDAKYSAWSPPTDLGVTTDDWEVARGYASNRPLLKLVLSAANPETAGKLLACAQPFGAEKPSLAVQVNGTLKEGGTVAFTVRNTSHNGALKPLTMANTLWRACQEGATTYTARLTLTWPRGLIDCSDKFKQAQKPADMQITADFGPATVSAHV